MEVVPVGLRRRQLLVAAGVSFALPGTSFSQASSRTRRIGMLSGDRAESGQGRFQRELIAGLRRYGYQEGVNLIVEWRWADGYPERLDALAKELVEADVELIVTFSQRTHKAAKRATRTTPIVMHAATTPVESGLIQSLASPGGIVTGTSWAGVEVVEKIFQHLREALPAAVRIAVMRDPSNPDARTYMDAYERTARVLGLSIEYFFITRPDQVDAALTRIDASRPDALFVAGQPAISPRYPAIVAFATARKLFTVGTVAQFVEEGGMLSYAPDRRAILARTASYVDRVLQGAKPADLPVELPTKYELVINARTARAIGYTVPQSLLLRADRVIE